MTERNAQTSLKLSGTKWNSSHICMSGPTREQMSLYVCLFVCLFVCLSVCLSVCDIQLYNLRTEGSRNFR